MKKIVIIGSGNLAEALAGALVKNPDVQVQLFARNRRQGERISRLTGCRYTDQPPRWVEADLCLLAVSDRAVAEVSSSFDFGDAVVAHLGGSVPRDELSTRIRNRGVLYPLQTFSSGHLVDWKQIPVFIEGNNPYTEETLMKLAQALSSKVYRMTSEQRLRIHLAAVFVCNFVNHMLVIGEGLLDQNGLPNDLLRPLMEQTLRKAMNSPSARQVQTGPAVRGDSPIQQKHMDLLLQDHPRWHELYKNISLDIWETSKKI